MVRPRGPGHAALLAEAIRARVHGVPAVSTGSPRATQHVRHAALLVELVHGPGAAVGRLLLRYVLLRLLLPPQAPRRGQHAGRVVEEHVEEEEDGPGPVHRAAPGAVPARVGGAEQREEVAEVEEGDGADQDDGHHHEAGAQPAHEQVEECGEPHLSIVFVVVGCGKVGSR